MTQGPQATSFRGVVATIVILLIALAWIAHGHRQASTGKEEVAAFTRRFALAVTNGRSLVASLNDEIAAAPDPRFRNALADVESQVEKGSTLSGAMARHPEFFDDRYVAAVRQGEKSGTLEVALQRLSNERTSR